MRAASHLLPRRGCLTISSTRWGRGRVPLQAQAAAAPPLLGRALHTTAATSAPGELAFWKDLWATRKDVFTEAGPNVNMLEFVAPHLRARAEADDDDTAPSVLVPLCGRSPDLAYLAKQDYFVVGVEGIGDALRLWALDNGGIKPILQTPTVTSYASLVYPSLQFIHADVFAVDPAMFGGHRFDAVWDRGGVTSIVPLARPRYLRLLGSLLAPAPRGRLFCEFLECNLAVEGALGRAELITALESAGFTSVRVAKEEDVRSLYPSFAGVPGLQYLREVVVEAQRRA